MGNTNIKMKVRLGNPIECGKGVLIPLILNDRNVKMIKAVKSDDGNLSEVQLSNSYETGVYRTREDDREKVFESLKRVGENMEDQGYEITSMNISGCVGELTYKKDLSDEFFVNEVEIRHDHDHSLFNNNL